MENKQKPVERETRQLIQTYNVLLKSQIYAYFAKTQRDHFVGRAFKTLEKEKQIYIHQDLEMAAINEEAFKARNVGTLQAQDLKNAADTLPDYPGEAGYVAKGAAYHYLAEAYLALATELGDDRDLLLQSIFYVSGMYCEITEINLENAKISSALL